VPRPERRNCCVGVDDVRDDRQVVPGARGGSPRPQRRSRRAAQARAGTNRRSPVRNRSRRGRDAERADHRPGTRGAERSRDRPRARRARVRGRRHGNGPSEPDRSRTPYGGASAGTQGRGCGQLRTQGGDRRGRFAGRARRAIAALVGIAHGRRVYNQTSVV
jgi:hypothetical protein